MGISDGELKELLEELKTRIGGVLLDNVETFLGSQAVAMERLKEELADAAWWTVQIAKAKDDAQAAACQDQLETVKRRILNKLFSFAVDASAEAKNTAKAVVQSVFDYSIEILPKIIGIIASMRG